MTVEFNEQNGGKVVIVRVTDRLSKEDYQLFVPTAERLIQQFGKIRVLVEMHDFHGWDAGALWEDIKFDAKHFRDIERLALVGEKKWEKGMSVFCKPFTTAEIRYFDLTEAEAAREWIQEGIEAAV
jgi:hypothetical protein